MLLMAYNVIRTAMAGRAAHTEPILSPAVGMAPSPSPAH